MIKEFDFETVVRAMTAKEIIMAMIEALKNPVTVINMDTFGDIIEGECHGCAATNAICKISNTTKDEFKQGLDGLLRQSYGASQISFLNEFENAVDTLRRGNLQHYNEIAYGLDIAQIKIYGNMDLPELTSYNYLDNLEPYIELAESQ